MTGRRDPIEIPIPDGAETVLTVRLRDTGAGTRVTLSHAGFASARARDAHAAAWPMVLVQQDARRHQLVEWLGHDESLPHNRSMPPSSLIPVRSYPDLDVAVTWLEDALGCRERLRVPGHRVQLTISNGAMVAAAWDAAMTPASGGRPPATLMLRVTDVDTVFARALAHGATAVTAPANHAFGERQAVLRDIAGHSWTLTQTIADTAPAAWGAQVPSP